MTLRRQTRLVRAGALFVLFGVLLPGISYMGHWGSAGEGHVHPGEEQTAAHQDHCHDGPSKCSGGVATVGTIWVGDEPFSIQRDSPATMVAFDETGGPADGHLLPIFQPPRTA
jgi:hypothetical protein